MRKLTLGALGFLALAIVYKVAMTIIAQDSGPFEAYSIENTTQAEINEKLEKLESFTKTFQEGDKVEEYARSIGFVCLDYAYNRQISNEKNIQIAPEKYKACEYAYGLFGAKIVIHVYMNKNEEILHIATANLYSEY